MLLDKNEPNNILVKLQNLVIIVLFGKLSVSLTSILRCLDWKTNKNYILRYLYTENKTIY